MAVTDFTPISARFGLLTVSGLPFKKEGKQNHYHVLCKCDCGNEKTVQCYNLTKGYTTSCGCAQRKSASQNGRPTVSLGHEYGRLTVLAGPFKSDGRGPWMVSCRCECGADKIAQFKLIANGHVQSCGCLGPEKAAQRNRDRTKHGHATSAERPTPTYRSWCSIKTRCLNPNTEGYAKYGARGIDICERWRDSFDNFLADMGPRPSLAHTVDRRKGNLGYFPGNCRWATKREQAENRKTTVWLEHDGATKTLTQLAREAGMSAGTLHSRLEMGWTLEVAISTPVKSRLPRGT